jgi:small subunit ribosomal protein S4e
MLKYALTSKEAKRIIKEGKFLVDGKVRLDEKFPVGIMDIIQLLDTSENFRLLPDHKGTLKLHTISQEESTFKLCRINGKTSISKGKTQLNLHDGKNIIIPTEEDNYRINDVLKINIPEKEILDHIVFKEMTNCILIGGRSQGIIGIITKIGQEPGWKKIVDIRTVDGENIRTLAKYVFVVGRNEPLISLKEID